MSREDAHDIVQEAFVLAIAKLDTAKNPKAWLYQVVDHLSANFHRKKVRRARLMSEWGVIPGGASSLRIRAEGTSDEV